MAKNWSAAEAARVAFEGKDKAAIQDIGKRFPLFLAAASRGSEGLLEIIGALHPERITARTIEAKLKEDVEETEEEEEEKPASKKAVKSEKPAKKGKKVEDDEEEDDEEEEEKPAKKGKKKDEKPAKKAAKKVEEEEEEDDEEEEEEETALEDMSLAELKKEAKSRKVDIKGLKSPKEIIKAIKAAESDEEEDEDEDDDDDWDL